MSKFFYSYNSCCTTPSITVPNHLNQHQVETISYLLIIYLRTSPAQTSPHYITSGSADKIFFLVTENVHILDKITLHVSRIEPVLQAESYFNNQ